MADTRTVFNLNQIVRAQLDSEEQLSLEKREAGITFRQDLKPFPLPVAGIDNQLRKALMNLVFNAAEAVSPRGTVSVSTDRRKLKEGFKGFEPIPAGNYATITVSDNGSGINPENIEHIFEPFYSTKVMGRSGTGLGLTVVWNCVHDHQGFIDLSSGPDGTTFTIYPAPEPGRTQPDRGQLGRNQGVTGAGTNHSRG